MTVERERGGGGGGLTILALLLEGLELLQALRLRLLGLLGRLGQLLVAHHLRREQAVPENKNGSGAIPSQDYKEPFSLQEVPHLHDLLPGPVGVILLRVLLRVPGLPDDHDFAVLLLGRGLGLPLAGGLPLEVVKEARGLGWSRGCSGGC